MGDRSVIITWEYDSAFIYQMEYATRWSNDWTNRPLVEAQVITGQESFDGLVEGETYKFHMRAIGKVEEGQDYYSTTEWSEYSHPILVTLGPPPAPASLGVSSKTETSVILSYGPVSGATYQVHYRKTTPDDSGSWDPYEPSSPVTGSTFPVEGLDSGTEYDFQVRAVGDGSRYKAEAGDWSEPSLVVRTAGFTALLPTPSLEWPCGGNRPDGQSPWAVYNGFANNSTHKARAEVWGNLVVLPTVPSYHGKYCVQARVISESTPGADSMTWTGELFKTVSSIEQSDLDNFDNMTPEDFYALYDAQEPAAGASATQSVTPHTCSFPCRGGTLQTDPLLITRKYIKVPAVYIKGTHVFTVGGVSHTLTTEAKDEADPAGELTQSLISYWGHVLAEVTSDVGPEWAQSIVHVLQGNEE